MRRGRDAYWRGPLGLVGSVLLVLVTIALVLLAVAPPPPQPGRVRYGIGLYGPEGIPLSVLIPAIVSPDGTPTPINDALVPVNGSAGVSSVKTEFGSALQVNFTGSVVLMGWQGFPSDTPSSFWLQDRYPGGVLGYSLWADADSDRSSRLLGAVRTLVEGLPHGKSLGVSLDLWINCHVEQLASGWLTSNGWSEIEVRWLPICI